MAYEETLTSQSYDADSDLSESQYKIVKVVADDAVDTASGSTDNVIGVLQGTPESGNSANVATAGITKVVAGEGVSAGDLVTSDADGKAQVAVVSDAAGVLGDMTRILGKVVNGAGDDEYASVLIDKQIAG